MKQAFYQGHAFDFPDDASDEEIVGALPGLYDQIKPTMGDVLAKVPGTASREFIQKPIANAARLARDLVGADTSVQQAEVKRLEEEGRASEQDLSLVQQGVLSGLSSVLGNVPAGAVGGVRTAAALARGASRLAAGKSGLGAATSVAGGATGLNTYGESRDAGLSIPRSLGHAALDFAIEKYTEYIPGSKLLENMNAPFFREFGKFLGRELTGEEIATVTQDLNAMMGARPDMTLKDIANDMLVTAVATAVAGPVQGGLTRAAGALIPGQEQSAAPPSAGLPPPPSGPAPAPSPATAIEGLLRPEGAVVAPAAPAAPTVPSAPVVDPQDQALQRMEQGPMVKIYGVQLEGQPAGETIVAIPGDQAGAQQLLLQAGGKGQILEAEMPQAQVEQLRTAQKADPDLQKQFFFGTEVLVPSTIFFGPPASGPGGVVPEGTTVAPLGAAGTTPPVSLPSPVAGEAAPSIPGLPPTQRLSVKLGKAPNRTILFQGKTDKERFQVMSKLRRLVKPNLTEPQREKLGREVQAGVSRMQVQFGEPDYATTLKVLSRWYDSAIQAVRQAEEGQKEVEVPELTQEEFNRIRDEVRGVTQTPKQKEVVAVAEALKKDEHVQRMKALLEKWIASFAPGLKIRIDAVGDLSSSIASVRHIGDGVYSMRVPNPMRGTLVQLTSLAHEFGHVLFDNALRNPKYVEQVDRLKQEWQAAMSSAGNLTALEWIKKYGSAGKVKLAKKTLENMGLTETSTALDFFDALDRAHAESYVSRFGEDSYRRFQETRGSYSRDFHEFAADQVSRYVSKKGKSLVPPELHSFFDAIVASMKTFYERVVKRLGVTESFEQWLDEMYSGKYLRTLEESEKIKNGDFARAIGEGLRDEFDYTTKVLSRLPKRERLKKVSVIQELNRADVKENERNLIFKVLNEVPGPTVDLGYLTQKVLSSLIPLTPKMTEKHADEGWMNTPSLRAQFNDGVFTTIVYQWPYKTPEFVNQHFSPVTENYFAHVREWYTRKVDGNVYVAEVQSDWNLDTSQRKELASIEKDVKADDELLTIVEQPVKDLIEDLHKAGWPAYHPKFKEAFVRQADFGMGSSFFSVDSPNYEILTETYQNATTDIEHAIFKGNLRDALNVLLSLEQSGSRTDKIVAKELKDQITGAIYQVSQFQQSGGGLGQPLGAPTPESRQLVQDMKQKEELSALLPKTWWHLVVRQYMSETASAPVGDGVKAVRFPTGKTASRIAAAVPISVQGDYVVFNEPRKLEPKTIQKPSMWDSMDRSQKAHFLRQVLKSFNKNSYQWNDSLEMTEANLTPDGDGLFFDASWKTIWNFYDKDLRAFLEKEYGAKEVVDESGNTWIEAPLKDLKGLPVEYFDLYSGMEDTVDAIAPGLPPELSGARVTFKGFLLNSLQINQLAKVFSDVPGLQRFRKAMQDMFSMKNRLLAAPNERMVEWYGLGREAGRKMEKFLLDEVNSGVHLTRLVRKTSTSAAPFHVHEPTPQLEAAAKAAGLSEQSVKVYLGIKNDFASMLDVMERMLLESVNRYFSKNPVLAQIRRLEVRAEFDRFREQPYFPDRGFGPWSVMVHAKKDMKIGNREIKQGDLLYWRKFENEAAQKRHKKKMEGSIQAADFTVSASFVEDLPYVLRGLPGNFTQLMVDELKLTPEQVEKLQQLRYDASKEGAFLKLLEKGKRGVGGGSTDLRRVYADYFWRSSNFVAKMFYSDEVNASLSDVHRQAVDIRAAGGNSNVVDQIHQRLSEKKDYVFNPQSEWEIFRMWVSLWYLWAVPKSALMNLSSLPTVGYAYLGARFGDVKATAAILRAMKDATMTIRDPAGAKLDADDHWALENALLDGTTDQSFAAELAAVTDANALERMVPWSEWTQDSQVADSTRQVIWKSIWMGMLPFRAIEGVNRRTMLLAAFRLNMAKGLDRQAAYQEAKDAVDYTQNDYSPWNKPKFLEGKKSVLLIFFSFIQNMAFFMYGGDRGWWRALMVLAALGGLFALPGMENFLDVINWAWKKFSGEGTDLRVEAHRAVKEFGANPELILHGALHSQGFLGWDTSASVSLGRIIPGTDIVFGQGKFNDRFVQGASEVGGPAASLAINGMKAMMDDTSPGALQRWEKVLPTVFQNLYKSTKMWENDAILDSQYRALVPDVTSSEIVGQALGFQATRKTERTEVLRAQRDSAEFYRLRRESLLSALWLARQAGDVKAENSAEEDIDRYNQKVPDRKLQISRQDIRQSMKSREKSVKEVEDQIPREKKYRAIYDDVEAAFRKE